ncbi:MinD/ParA family protein [Desulfopila inferna]|uniref:MinD/ParA family protein n=1 Tax=Desulfopila inferna TaxID=468528 RepID=UPI0019632161|nr:MinD/ParA family protein [Desulfopila inferna]MBM9602990.1 MinD/ParA family protein [Desulfopila inferna]
MINQKQSSADQAQTLRAINTGKSAESISRSNEAFTQVFSITSGKGGVGKTAVVANTAVTLAKMGKSVLILDADLGLANVDVVFGLAPQFNLNHFFSGEHELEDIMVEGPYGIKILPAGSGIQNFTRLDGHHKMRLLDGLDTMHEDFDFVLIDTEAGISENVTYFNTAAQEILVVTTPDPTAITDAYALMKLLSTQFHEKHFNLIVNQTQNDEEGLDVYRKITMVANRYLDISIDYLGSIPVDKLMIDSIRKQKVFVDMHPSSSIADAFSSLAARLCSEKTTTQPKGNLQFFWKKLLNLGNRE